MKDLRNRRVLVVGLGRSGEAAARFLARRGARVTVTDARPEPELRAAAGAVRALGVELRLGGHDPELFRQPDLIVISPGVSWDMEGLAEARRRGIEVVGEVELASWFLRGKILAVTGSNGKTTTTAMIGHLLRAAGVPSQVGGNIGMPYPPAIDLVESDTDQTWNVLEVSSFQLESIRTFRPHIGAILNVTPDHLDRHGSFEAYVRVKGRMLENQQPEDWAVLNADDGTCVGYGEQARARVAWFSRKRPTGCGTWVRGGEIVGRHGGREAVLAEVEGLAIRGAHNLENALAATAAAFLAGASPEAIRAAVPAFRGVEHRLEFVRQVDGVDYYNDSKATNVDAAIKALEAFEGRLWVILGGQDKNSDYTLLRDLIRRKARGVLLIGAAAEKIARQLGDAAPQWQAGTLEQAVRLAAARAEPGDTVLLAPACASFDQFRDYAHRGRVFKELVGNL